MDDFALDSLLTKLEGFSASNDPAVERRRKMLNITHDTGEFFLVLVRALRPRHVLEIGTSNGYSTLWLAQGLPVEAAPIVTVEESAMKVALARENFQAAGLQDRIRLLHAEAGEILRETESNSYDFIFLDSERSLYPQWWPDVNRVLRPGGVLVADNATSHPQEIEPLLALIRSDSNFTSCVLTVGQGELFAVKLRQECTPAALTEGEATRARRALAGGFGPEGAARGHGSTSTGEVGLS